MAEIGLFGHHPGPRADEWRPTYEARARALEAKAAALPLDDPQRVELEADLRAALRRRAAPFGGAHSREQRDQSTRIANIARSRDDGA